LHQLRVAAVGKLICDNFDIGLSEESEIKIETENVVIACLLHDMGNIIKFDLKAFPELLEPKGYEYWKGVQEEFFDKYGHDEHQATFKIAKEIGINDRAFEILNAVGFTNTEKIYRQPDYNKKIILYSDQRVDINNVCSLRERLEKGRKRYMTRTLIKNKSTEEQFKKLALCAEKMEKQIFEKCRIRPEQINDQSALPVIQQLREISL